MDLEAVGVEAVGVEADAGEDIIGLVGKKSLI